ncbi:carbohydrate-binding protein [Flavobacterium alvei]|uniref:carbohydrate-binding protein n=1 Tax=Flavobacterium alvei TaxID=2080416 RepID=UPI0026F2CF45|nr:carbohydrate-binding protein [Flavobacterium alvei]
MKTKIILFLLFLLPFFSGGQTFVHPGLSHKSSDLERMRYMVLAGKEPWKSSFTSLSQNQYASYNYVVQGNTSTTVIDATTADYERFKYDGLAAYYNALMWSITGDTRHADKAVEIFNAWVNIKRINSGGTKALDAGRVIWKMLEGAEIIKNTYSGWAQTDIDKFKAMLVYPGYSQTTVPTAAIASEDATFYWYMYNGDPGRYGNQGLFAWKGIMAMGIFMDNRVMYDRALRYLTGLGHRSDDLPYQSGPARVNATPDATSNIYYNVYTQKTPAYETTTPDYGFDDQIQHYFHANGQSQESDRDQGHAILGASLVLSISEMAWNQGDNIYSYLDNRPLLALEYGLRYNTSLNYTFPDQLSPWEPTIASGEFIQSKSRSGRWESLQINPWNAGDLTRLTRGVSFKGNESPFYELALAYYKDRISLPADKYKWTQRVQEISVQESGYEQQGFQVDHPGFGGLTFRRVFLCPGDPITFASGSPTYQMNVLPGTIQAENYDYFNGGGQGKTYNDLGTTNTGNQYRTTEGVDIESCTDIGLGYNVTNMEPGEWLNYTVSVPTTGFYNIKIRYAALNSSGKIRFDFDGIDKTGEITIPYGGTNSTGSQDWKDFIVSSGVPLQSGVQSMRIFVSGTATAFNLNSITISKEVTDNVVLIEDDFEGTNNDVFFAPYTQPTTVGPSTANVCNLVRTLVSNLPGNLYMTSLLDSSVTPPASPSTNGVKIIKTTGTTLNDAAVRLGSATSLALVMDIKHAGTNTGYVKSSADIKISTTFSGNLASTNLVNGLPRKGNGISVGFYGTLSGKYATNLDSVKYATVTTTFGCLNKFIGFVVNPDSGRIAMWTSAQTGSTDNPSAVVQAYQGNYLPTATTQGETWTDMNATGGSAVIHQLSYTINTLTGGVYNFTLDGKTYDWSGYTPFSAANSTDYATIGANSSSSKDAYFYHFKVEHISTSQTIWNGNSWSNGTPNSTVEAVIAGNYNTATSGPFTAKKITVNSGILTISPGTSITILNELINNSNATAVIIENGANLIQINGISNTGAITVKRDSAPQVRLDHTLWSSPVTGQNLFNFSTNTLTNRFYIYDTTANKYATTGLSSNTNFTPGKGYAIRAPNDWSSVLPATLKYNGVFTGVPNNGVISNALATDGLGYNLVGNPYPSPIDGVSFLANNPALGGTLYFYAHTSAMDSNGNYSGNNYATWVSGTGGTAAIAGAAIPNGIIQTGQGFIVKATGAGNVNFSNEMRSFNTTNQFFKTSSTTRNKPPVARNRVWLDLTNDNGTAFNQILVGYITGATLGVDRDYDGMSFGDATTALSSKIAGVDYTIQGRALPFSPDDLVPLGFKAAIDGNYTISVSNTDGLFSGSQPVFIKDKSNGNVQDLKIAPYTFTATAGMDDTRFELVYAKTLGISDNILEKKNVRVLKKEGTFEVDSNGMMMKEISVFNIQGRLVLKQSGINATIAVLKIPSQINGVLLFKIVSQENKTETIKVIN